MRVFNKEGKLVAYAKATRRPKFSHHRGRTWDCIDKVIDGKVVEFWFDSTWGENFYFEFNDRWYYMPIIRRDYTDGLKYREELFTSVSNKHIV